MIYLKHFTFGHGQKNIDATQGKIAPLLIKLWLPILASSIVQQLYMLSNAFIVGQFAGKEGMSAIQASSSMINLPVGFGMGICAGVAIICGQAFGAHDRRSIVKCTQTSFFISIILGLVLCFGGIVFAPHILRALHTPDQIFADALRFAQINFVASVFLLIQSNGCSILTACGNTKTPTYVISFMCAMNIVLDIIFIGVLHMGVLGSGLSIFLSWFTSACVILVILSRTNQPWQMKIKDICYHPQQTRAILKSGIPLAIQSCVYAISNIFAQGAINSFGTNAIAAWGLSGRIHALIPYMCNALVVACTIVSSQNYGARQYERVSRCFRSSFLVGLFCIASISGLIFLFAKPICQIFIADEQVINLSVLMLQYLEPFIFVFIFFNIMSAVIRGTGKSFYPMVCSVIGICVYRILWILFYIPGHNTLESVLLCFPIAWVIVAGLLYMYYYKGHWLYPKIAKHKKKEDYCS